jgi:hypothetical protein
MRLVRTSFPVEIDRRIPGVVGRLTGLILSFETLLASPGLQQGAIDREMLGGQESAAASLRDDLLKEGPRDVAVE